MQRFCGGGEQCVETQVAAPTPSTPEPVMDAVTETTAERTPTKETVILWQLNSVAWNGGRTSLGLYASEQLARNALATFVAAQNAEVNRSAWRFREYTEEEKAKDSTLADRWEWATNHLEVVASVINF